MRRDQLLYLVAGIVIGLVVYAVYDTLRPPVGAVPAEMAAQALPPAAPPASRPASPTADAPAVDRKTSAENIRRALEAHPNEPHALAAMGELLLGQDRIVEGLEHLERAVENAGDDATLYFRIAGAFRRARRPARALEVAQKGLTFDLMRWEPAAEVFDLALNGAGNFPAAEEALAELRRRNPQFGHLGQLSQQLEQARSIVNNARQRPGDAQAQVAAGNHYYDTAQWAKAESCYRNAIELGQDPPEVLTDLGTCIGRQGRTAEALSFCEQALKQVPDYWKAAYNGVVISYTGGDQASARHWLHRLRTLRPDHPGLPSLEHRIAEMGSN